MKDAFYLTLPSNSSMSTFPSNKTTNFVTQLPQRLRLQGEWQVGLVEFHYPQTFANVNKSNNVVHYGIRGKFIEKFKLPLGYYSMSDIVAKINDHAVVGDNVELTLEQGYVTTSPSMPSHVTFGAKRSEHASNSTSQSEEVSSQLDFIHVSPNLAIQMGFNVGVNLMDSKRAVRPATSALGVPNQIFIYTDIVEAQFVGDTSAPLLRNVHIDKGQYLFGSQMVCTFDTPHYVNVSRTDFETIEIDLRTDTGDLVPFEFGTSCVKLHFRKVNAFD